MTSPTLFSYSEDIDLPVVKPGFVKQHRTEGWATTCYGQYDMTLADSRKIDSGLPTLVFWGDSYVEAHHVDYDSRMQSGTDINSIGLGRSGQSIADYYFKIPMYEKIVDHVACHVIFLGSIDDVMPNNSSAWYSQFIYGSQENSMIELSTGFDSSRLKASKIDTLSYYSKIYFLRKIARRLKGFEINMIKKATVDSKPGKQLSKNTTEKYDVNLVWDQLLSKFKPVTEKPIVFVYAPSLPRIKSNRISYDDADGNVALAFRESCEKAGYHFINMKERFTDNFLNTGQFPRGFNNTKPGVGHLNSVGHKLVADVVNDFLKEHPGVIHTN